jgi:hypothetical protein
VISDLLHDTRTQHTLGGRLSKYMASAERVIGGFRVASITKTSHTWLQAVRPSFGGIEIQKVSNWIHRLVGHYSLLEAHHHEEPQGYRCESAGKDRPPVSAPSDLGLCGFQEGHNDNGGCPISAKGCPRLHPACLHIDLTSTHHRGRGGYSKQTKNLSAEGGSATPKRWTRSPFRHTPTSKSAIRKL